MDFHEEHRRGAMDYARAAWSKLTKAQRTKLLRLHSEGRGSKSRTLEALVQAQLAEVEPGALHGYVYRRTGWGAFVAHVASEDLIAEETLAGAAAEGDPS